MKVIAVAIAVIAVAAGVFGYARLGSGQRGEEFLLKTLDRGDIIQTVSATGTIEPVVKVIVGSQVSGKIKKWYADFNAEVTAGFVLAELDPDRFQTARDQASAELALARAREEETRVRYLDAQRERKRIEALMQRNNASENEFLVAKAAEEAALAVWHGAQASVQSAQAALDAAKVDLDHTIIRSPIDGVVIARNIDVGQTVAASLQAPELFVIANDLRRMQVNANVAEADVGLIREGGPATFTVDAFPGRTFTGKISQIRYNPTTVESVVTYVTLIEVSNDDLALRPGMTANVTFEVARAENVVRIPNAALRFDPTPPEAAMGPPAGRRGLRAPTVYILQNGRPRPVELKIGLTDGTFTALAGGELKEGVDVITDRAWRGRGPMPPDPSRTLRPTRF